MTRTIISVGSINADFAVRTDEAPSGSGALLAHDLLRTSGGKAANVALLAVRLGAPAVLLACVGDDDLAEQATAGPAREGVDMSRLRRRPGPTAYSSVIVPPSGEKSIFLALNANDAWSDDAEGVAADITAAPDGSIVVVDLEIPPSIVTAALQAARERGFVTIVDPAPASRLDDAVLSMVDHLTPDHSEAEELTGIDTTTEDGAARAAEQLLGRGAGTVHVKLAQGGCATATAEGVTITDPLDDMDVVDATGAGDAFAGGLAWALFEGRSEMEAVRVAVAAASYAVTGYGSQESYPDRSGLEPLIERVRSRDGNR